MLIHLQPIYSKCSLKYFLCVKFDQYADDILVYHAVNKKNSLLASMNFAAHNQGIYDLLL